MQLKSFFFTVANITLKQDIGIPMGVDPAPFWANLFLTFPFVQAQHFHSTKRFTGDLCAMNDSDEFRRAYI